MAAAVVILALTAPAVATAGGQAKCRASACLVYHEQSAPTAGKKHPQRHQRAVVVVPTTGKGPKHAHAPNKVARVLSAVGSDRGTLSRLLNDSGTGTVPAGAGTVAAPTALGAAADLGSGPTALLAVLVASALGLGIYAGVRSWRHRRASA
jgi:hypothetical protein